MTPKPRIGSLCTGAAGLDMAVEAVFDAVTVWQSEVDPAASRVLAHRYPGVPNLGDLTTVDWATVPPIDILSAGYPCQPDSLAGKGLSEDDHRWIWPDIARAVSVLRPRLIVLENVSGHFIRGFRTVLGSLTELGYDTQWTLVRASDVGAPHRRERLFVVAAVAADIGHERRRSPRTGRVGSTDGGLTVADSARDGRDEGRPESARVVGGSDAPVSGAPAPDSDSDSLRVEPVGQPECSRPPKPRLPVQWGEYGPAIVRWQRVLRRIAPPPTEPNSRGGQRLSPRFVEWLMGWPAGWVTDVPNVSRNDQLKICGNGVVPQQAAHALRALLTVDASLAVSA